MQRFIFFIILLFSVNFSSNAQYNYSSEFNFGINFYSANREEIVFDKGSEESLKGQYEFTTRTKAYNSLKKDSSKVVRFINAVNRAILIEKITPYNMNFSGDPNSLEIAEPKHFFYQNDTEFVQNEKGDLYPLPISDTVDYSKIARIDCIQEWFYNFKKNKLEVQTISFSPVLPKYDEFNYFKGCMKYYTRKQTEFSSIKNRKKIVKSSNTIWAQRIYLSVPIKDFKNQNSSYKISQPIKTEMNPQLSEILFNQILNKKIKAYIPHTNIEYTGPRLDSLMTSRKDTEFIECKNGDLKIIEVIKPYRKDELSKLKIKQALFFNYKTLKIEARIEKIILTIYKNDSFDHFLENKELFEIRFKY